MIALIEDNASIAQLIVVSLEMRGYHVKHFSDGPSFLTTLQSFSYDIILTDFTLPGSISGLQIITSLQERCPELPIIVITAASESSLTHLHVLYPAMPVLHKPFKIQDLFQKIASVNKKGFQAACSAEAVQI